jgi:hypothetical protein
VFVSPKAPRLAKRIEEGMESMVHDGTLMKMMLQANAELLGRAQLCKRRVFHIINPQLSAQTSLERKELWFNPFDARNGVCSHKLKPHH